ncbi:MAG: tRNA (guanosine(37)-N1)-methyltransferase TrmD [Candidatus Nealsonbacteria bacterium CG09_land_8_20_14_0_10_42_14]|uniref:tRNA (guanine-N(1)-)-methyltransferase n=1 Tax=Candidatus Nealsonbacteria bacterium CG09_land_8_20_14_0_10_42_14 TaxID=1974707 RepID=A0A2H0WXD3_9BACT|nr:MAG: tRNA (guanosine(37)-N1)-methyltransferase TrmD [Candidatus Nealsonbacteria bacterium CG09_land_8_20_14_0_10_42_14]
MLIFDIITIFPEIFDSYFKESILQRAQKKGLLKIKVHDLRKWAKDRHRTVDDKPFGGGRGMVLKIEPLYKAVKALRKPKSRVILFSPRGKKFNQVMATKWSKMNHFILICGRYEGVDERVAKHLADEVVSIGDYVLMGGELPALVLIETVSRLIPGVLGKSQVLKKERVTKEKGFIEFPQYTRPEAFKNWKVPKVLLSGDHKKIEEWRKKQSKVIEK